MRVRPRPSLPAIVLVIAGCGQSSSPYPSPSPPPSPRAPTSPAAVLALVNAGRAQAGVPPFTLDPRLSAAARSHANDMASGRVPMGHSGFPDRLYAAGYPRRSAIAEGVFGMADGFGWDYWVPWLVANPHEAHGRDFRNPAYRDVGIGTASGPAGGFGVLDYGGPP